MPPTTQTASMAPGPGSRSAMPAGDRKIPDPMVIPTTIVMAPKSPRRLGSASFPGGAADMRLWYSRTRRGARHAARGIRRAAPRPLNSRRPAYTFRRVFIPDIRPPAPAVFRWTNRMTVRSALFWIAAASCVLAELVILRSLLFGRAREAERQPMAGPLAHVTRARRPAEIAWAILPAVGLFFVLYLTWRAVDAPAPAPSAPELGHTGATIGA